MPMANNKPSKDFSTRYTAAKKWRDVARPYLEEIYSFICPGREYDFSRKPISAREDDPETFISLPESLATDFAADLVTYFTPAEAKWTEYLVTAPVEKSREKAVLEVVNGREDDLFDMITGSNYNDVAPQVMFEANHGTIAMWVESAHMTQPIFCETVPPDELLTTPGHLGILDRFREKCVLASSLTPLFDGWDEVSLEDPRIERKVQRPGTTCKVCWGFWVDWDDPGNPVWRCEVTVDGIRVSKPEPMTLGPLAGSCPLLVGRFNPQPKRPWGRGPAWAALGEMRVSNAVSEAVLDGLDQSLKNTLLYADDGFLDFSEGVESGRAYPAARGFTRDQVYELNRGVNLDTGLYTEDRFEDRLRTMFFQDGPRQRGDTPPTASQWVDERRRVQQRLGKPSAPLWKEFFLPFIQRIETIGVEVGKLDGAMTHNGEVISVLPISPLQKAQNQDKVMVSRSNLDLGAGAFGDAFGQVIDLAATFENIIEASGDDLTVINKEEPANDAATPPE